MSPNGEYRKKILVFFKKKKLLELNCTITKLKKKKQFTRGTQQKTLAAEKKNWQSCI